MGLRFWGTWHMVPSMHTHPLLRTHMQDFLCSPHKSSQVLSGVYMSGEWHPCHLLNVACNSLGFLCHVRWQLSTVLCWEIGSPVCGLFRRPGPEGRHEVNGVFSQGEVAPGPALFCFFCKVRGFVPPLTSHHDQFKAVGSTSWEQQPGKVWDKNKPPSLKLIVSDGVVLWSAAGKGIKEPVPRNASPEPHQWKDWISPESLESAFEAAAHTVIILCLRTEI